MEKWDEICELCNETLDFFQLKNHRFTSDKIEVNMDYIGEGYAIPTKECIEAIKLVAQKEGIFLDPVYTGKAMAGLIDLVKKGRFKRDDNVVFIHTGGDTALFGYNSVFQKGAENRLQFVFTRSYIEFADKAVIEKGGTKGGGDSEKCLSLIQMI